jgi:hypothetical protein
VSITIVRNVGWTTLVIVVSVDEDCESCGVNGTYGISDTLPKHSATQDELRLCENGDGGNHPWHGLDFDYDLLSEF